MHITVDLAGYYSWEPLPKKDVPTGEDLKKALASLRIKESVNALSGYLRKEVVPEDVTHVVAAIPESQIQSLLEHGEQHGIAKTRGSIAAMLLETTILPHQAHPTHIQRIWVHDEPEVEKFLNMYFNCDSAKGGDK